MKHKKGETYAFNVAALILLIALFITLYVVFIPIQERDRLLGLDRVSVDKEKDKDISEEVTLLSASPGEVHEFSKDTVEKKIQSIALFSRIEEDSIALADSLIISKSFFKDDSQKLFFKLDNLYDVERVSLFFFVEKAEGKLTVEINGNKVFEDRVDLSDIPIELPLNSLRKQNTLELSVSPGLFTNEYRLAQVQIKKEFLSENKLARRTFVLTPSERANVKKANLKYFIDCRTIGESKQGMLTLLLNNRLLSSNRAFCDVGLVSQDIDKNRLLSGVNTLEFKIDKGDYSIEDIILELEVAEKIFPKYEFNINDVQFEAIEGTCDEEDSFECLKDCRRDCREDCRDDCGGDDNICYEDCKDDCYDDCQLDCDISICDRDIIAKLEMNFKDERGKRERKKATVTINEDEIHFDTHDKSFEVDISEFVRRGSNFIKIVPRVTFEIEHLRVFLEEEN